MGIRFSELETGYSSRRKITQAFNCQIPPGKLSCLLGPNGSGKSTLLKTAAGFLKPLGGKVEILGTDISYCNASDLARIAAIVLTDRPDLRNMTARELVMLGRSPYTGFWGTADKKDRHETERALQATGASHLADRNIASLSDGERQKVMIAKALAQSTPVILLDEPTAFLDYPSKAAIMLMLKKIASTEQKTVLLSTHDLELALKLADMLLVLDEKELPQAGSPEELIADGTIEKYFKVEGAHFDRKSRSYTFY